jgi:uncharacterized membrane protein
MVQALLVAFYARIALLDRSIPFAILAVMLAAAYAAATEILAKRDDRPGLQASIALFATGTLAALALALTFALEKGWLTIALALMSFVLPDLFPFGTSEPVMLFLTGMVLAYLVFGGIALVFSFDEDDWVIARAAWSRLRRLGGHSFDAGTPSGP